METHQNLFTSAVEAKHSEVLKDTQTTISCVVSGLTKKLDAVTWEKPDSGGAITDGTDGYQIDVETYQGESNSQTTNLTIPAAHNGVDDVFTCVITSNEHGISEEQTTVKSDVFSKYPRNILHDMYRSSTVLLILHRKDILNSNMVNLSQNVLGKIDQFLQN